MRADARLSFERITGFIRQAFRTEDPIPLHEPRFIGREREYLLDCLDSTFVSSVGRYVDLFERMTAEFTGSPHAVATVNGTAALHAALLLAGVRPGDEVLTQAVSFVATANAINYSGAEPVFLDSDRQRLGLAPEALAAFLAERAEVHDDSRTYDRVTGRRLAACVPMHVFGHPVDLPRIMEICARYSLPLIEDAAESLGSLIGDRHTGTFGRLGILSFNGNKTITTGGGGMILTADENLARVAKHLTTTAKVPHPWEYVHDRVGFNYRLPNLNAALGCAQMESLPRLLAAKRELAAEYAAFFRSTELAFVSQPAGTTSNYWLNAIILPDRPSRDEFLKYSNDRGVMTRPLWALAPDLPMYAHCQTDGLENARWLADRAVNLPSSPRI